VDRHTLILGGAVVALLLYSRRGFAVSNVDLISEWKGPRLNEEQRSNIAIIQREFAAAGYPSAIQAGAVINAWAESRIHNNRIGDSGKSVGLFQLHENGGGRGLSVAQRKNPIVNTRRIISEMEASKMMGFLPLRSADSAAYLFCWWVERPAHRDKPYQIVRPDGSIKHVLPINPRTPGVSYSDSDYRAALARQFFPIFPSSDPERGRLL